MEQSSSVASKFYLITNKGVERRSIFNSKDDYDRFTGYLYLLNDRDNPRAANFFLKRGNRSELFSSSRFEQLVSIGAYSLLPDQFYLLLSPLSPDGISKFMQKLQTAYTMFFNRKYSREGVLFQGSYRLRELVSVNELEHTFAFVHLSPAVLFEKNWETLEGHKFHYYVSAALEYKYSSAGEFLERRPVITSPGSFPKQFSKITDRHDFTTFWKSEYIRADRHRTN
ncbi:MAG: hypothetical protein RIQ56_162 [Candidatus Parcubacteria bacterium]|jgi:hypothetical protein